MSSRKITDLLPQTANKVMAWLAACENTGLHIILICTYRSPEEQTAFYAQGRSPLAVTNELRSKAGMGPISEEENLHIRTNCMAGQSGHQKHRAADFLPIVGGKPVWSDKSDLWAKAGKLAKDHGLEWAGDWHSFKEVDHVEDKETYNELIKEA